MSQEDRNQSTETDPEMTCMAELVYKDSHNCIPHDQEAQES